MQVGLTSSSLATGGAHSAAVSSSTVAPTQAVRQKLPATASEYPASPLITTRPQRYSVQLNDQLTTLQQADHYLGQLEQQLLDYRHSQRKGGDCTQRYKVVPESADYACIRCSEIIHMNAGEKQLCPRCANPEWTKASRAKRVT